MANVPTVPKLPPPPSPRPGLLIPLGPLSGYTPHRIDVRLTGRQAATLKRVAAGLGARDPATAVARLLDLIAEQPQ